LREHRDVAAVELIGGGAHALGEEALQVRMNVWSFLPTMYQLASTPRRFTGLRVEQFGWGTPWVAQTSFCSSSEGLRRNTWYPPDAARYVIHDFDVREDLGLRNLDCCV